MKVQKAILIFTGLAILLLGLFVWVLRRPADTSLYPDPAAAAEPTGSPITEATFAPSPEPTPEPTPDLSPLPDSWFDDAAFFGDSITILLQKHCAATGDLGEALFLGTYSYSVSDAVTGDKLIGYQNSGRLPQDVAALSGAKKLFILLGNNDIAHTGELDSLMENWAILLSNLREKSPDAVVFIESCLPAYRWAQHEGWNNELFDAYNDRLRAFCVENGCVFVNLAHYLKDENNCLAEEYCSDQFCHLTPAAVEIWVEQLKNPENYSVNPRSFFNEQRD